MPTDTDPMEQALEDLIDKHGFTHSASFVRSISEKIYRLTLAADAGGHRDNKGWREGAADRQIAKDGDGGVKFSNRAGAYDKLTRIYLTVLNIEEPK